MIYQSAITKISTSARTLAEESAQLIIERNRRLIEPINYQAHGNTRLVGATPKIPDDDLISVKGGLWVNSAQAVKIFVTGPDLIREWFGQSILALTSDTRLVEINKFNRADKADTILRLRPHVVIHCASTSNEDYSLIKTIKKNLPTTCYIVLGDTSATMFRVKSSAAGVNHILGQRYDLRRVFDILRSIISVVCVANPYPNQAQSVPGSHQSIIPTPYLN